MQIMKFVAELHFYGTRCTAANWFRFCWTEWKQKFEI